MICVDKCNSNIDTLISLIYKSINQNKLVLLFRCLKTNEDAVK